MKTTISTQKPLRHLAVALVASALALPALAASDDASTGMKMTMPADAPVFPAVHGFIAGQPMLFIHTATSDAGIAKILTDMMGGSPVAVVPALAGAPSGILAPVYAFTNGYAGSGPMGPLGGQPDIFTAAPGEPGYSPLHEVFTVTWADGAEIVPMKSWDQLKRAIDSGAVDVRQTGIVVNMPFLTWPGGSR